VDADVSGQGGAVLNAAMRMAWVISLVWVSRDLLAGVDLAQREPGRDGPVGALGGVQVGLCCAQSAVSFVVVGCW